MLLSKKVFVPFLLAVSLLCSEEIISPDNYFPENIEGNTPYEFGIEDPGDSQSSFVIAHENNGTVDFYNVPTNNNLQRADTETGKIDYNREHNLSNTSDLDKWLSQRANSFAMRANQISQKIQEKNGFGDTSERGVASVARDYIYENSDQNSTRRRVIDKIDDVYHSLHAKIASQDQIKCYASRKLKPGYLCPLPTMENSFILGYAQKDDKKIAQAECNDRCKIQKSCIEQRMPFDMHKIENPSLNLVTNPEYIINVNDRQTVKTVELKLNITGLDEEKLKNNAYKIRYGASYFYKEHWYDVFENYKVVLQSDSIALKFYLNKSAEKIKIKFHRPFEVDPYIVSYEIVLDPALHNYTLESARVNYSDDKHYYCPVTQYVLPDEDPTIACKNGHIEDVFNGSSVVQICVPDNLPNYRDSQYGGYKSRALCEVECMETGECIPTYRRPSVLDYNGYVPENKYDIEIGCIDDPSNQACTQEKCRQFFVDYTQPIEEKIWTNNDDIVTTVKDSTSVEGVERPKIDIEAELSSNGTEKEKVFKDEMKDSAYNAMIKRGTYNVSSLKINEKYPAQNAYQFKEDKLAKRASLTWYVKAASELYDNGKTYRFFPVMSVDVVYHPIKAINVNQHTIYASEDPNIRAIDRLFMVKTASDWKIFKRMEYVKMYVKDNNGTYNWRDTLTSGSDKDVTFEDGEFKAYANTMTVNSSLSKKLNSGTPYEQINISLDMEYMISQIDGVLFSSQTNNGSTVSKIYSNDPADIDESTRAFIYSYSLYGVYYDTPAPTIGRIKNDYAGKQFFDYLKRKEFPSEIKSETLYSDDKIKMYIHGIPRKMSVNAKFSPSSAEEGKKTFFFNFLYDE